MHFSPLTLLLPFSLLATTALSTPTTRAPQCIFSVYPGACANPTPPYFYPFSSCPPNQGSCYPTTYYQSYDLGTINGNKPTNVDAIVFARCSDYCTKSPACRSWVVATQYAADSPLTTSQCFLYASQRLTPRGCADAPSRLIFAYKAGNCPA